LPTAAIADAAEVSAGSSPASTLIASIALGILRFNDAGAFLIGPAFPVTAAPSE
jgi:hypothetical protein